MCKDIPNDVQTQKGKLEAAIEQGSVAMWHAFEKDQFLPR